MKPETANDIEILVQLGLRSSFVFVKNAAMRTEAWLATHQPNELKL